MTKLRLPLRALALPAVVTVVALLPRPLAADPDPVDGPGARAFAPITLAVIGDTPYGAAQVVDFPGLVQSINGDPAVSRVVHVGDIKNGSSRCDDSYFATVKGLYDSFADPFLLTPGDNEWTDCH